MNHPPDILYVGGLPAYMEDLASDQDNSNFFYPDPSNPYSATPAKRYSHSVATPAKRYSHSAVAPTPAQLADNHKRLAEIIYVIKNEHLLDPFLSKEYR